MCTTGSSSFCFAGLWFHYPMARYILCNLSKIVNWLVGVVWMPQGPSLFHLPLTTEAYAQLQQLARSFQNLQLQATRDRWSYIWGSSTFSSSRAYRHLIGHRQVHRCYSWLWCSACQHKRKVFFWLLLKDMLSTMQLLRRKFMFLDEYNCVFCISAIEEDLLHPFFQCPFAITCWFSLQLQVPNSSEVEVILEAFKSELRLPIFLGIVITMCWAIWMVWNNSIFHRDPPSIPSCKSIFRKEFALVVLRANS